MEYEGYKVRGFNDYLDSYITQKRALMGEPFDHGSIPTQSNATISLKEQATKNDIADSHKPTGSPTIGHDTAPHGSGKHGAPWEKLVQGYNRYKGWAGFGGGLLASTLLLNRLSSPPKRKEKKKR